VQRHRIDLAFRDPTETTPQGRTNAMRLVERFLQEAEKRGFKQTSTVWALMRRNTPNPRLANLVQEAMGLPCKPLKQRFAQRRYIKEVLGLPIAGIRPDGLPLVGRTIVDEKLNNKKPSASERGFNWSK
jgi:hypothetical protein